MIKTLLESTSCSEDAMEYLIKQPSPSYVHLRYIDWVRPWVNEVINTLSTLSLSDKKKEEAVQKISLCNLYLDDLYSHLQKREALMFVMVAGQISERVQIQYFTD